MPTLHLKKFDPTTIDHCRYALRPAFVIAPADTQFFFWPFRSIIVCIGKRGTGTLACRPERLNTLTARLTTLTARPKTGKSTLVTDILHTHRHIESGIVMSATE